MRRKLLNSNSKERKTMSTFILTIKIIDFGVKEFSLVMRVLVRCFCALKLSKKIDMIPKRFFVSG
jgi:hypothetical protein